MQIHVIKIYNYEIKTKYTLFKSSSEMTKCFCGILWF